MKTSRRVRADKRQSGHYIINKHIALAIIAYTHTHLQTQRALTSIILNDIYYNLYYSQRDAHIRFA